MAGRRWTTLELLIIFSLLGLSAQFEVRGDQREELRHDIADVNHLRRRSETMSHESLADLPETSRTNIRQSSVRRSSSRLDLVLNPLGLLEGLQNQDLKNDQDLAAFLADIEKQKMDDQLLTASEISHSYSQKLLVMTDRETSTRDRVRQEYSMDPHYSEIISEECLYNQSCVPDVDGYTVVKIFGSVSEDGGAVSGHSGSSLADLMLKTSLEPAPVFSLDGNTSRQFQHSFIRVFMLRGLRAVLETSQENQKTYQVMDQSESVSMLPDPPRPVDHSTQYDHQQILLLQDNVKVRKAAEFLYDKHPTASSMYLLDNNQKPKLIGGEDVPLSEDSRLVLVGHGAADSSGEMRVAGFTSQDLVQIIQRTFKVSDKIKTTSLVSCNAGADEAFIESLAKGLHQSGIETELHLRNTVVQVLHTGEKITKEVSPGGDSWRHKDDSKKVVATVDKNGDVIIRNEPGSRGREVFTNERNCLGQKIKRSNKRPSENQKDETQDYRNSWPEEPQTFIDPEVYKKVDQNQADQIKRACEELEGLIWGIFHSEQRLPNKVSLENLQNQNYLVGERQEDGISWINEEGRLRQVLQNCYEIKSGEDVRNIIRHFAKTGEDRPTYLMINDWIYSVEPKRLYVHPVGKKLNNNDNREERRKFITAQNEKGKESYTSIRDHIKNKKASYADYVRHILNRDIHINQNPENKFWFNWYFTASVISESARNFRTFPLTLMALEMSQNYDNSYIQEKGRKFLFEEHSMARGGSWIDPSRRGFSGSAAPAGSSTDKETQIKLLAEVITLESDAFTKWENTLEEDNIVDKMASLLQEYQISEDTSRMKSDYTSFKERVHDNIITTPGGEGRPSTSGALGGNDDGHVTTRDLNSATELENTFKHESHFLGTSASLSEEIHAQLKAKYGEALSGLRLQEGTTRIENGQFVCQLVSEGADAKPVEFRVELSRESLQHYEKMMKSVETAAHDMETHSSTPSHQDSKFMEHSGTAVGSLGLMMGLKGAVRAFEQGDIKDGVMGVLQTAHGVTAMVTSAVASKVLTSETRIAKSAAEIIRCPAMKRTMTAIPIVGIGFGIYNIEQDIERHDTLGYIDAGLDSFMTVLDVVELVAPEAAPFIAPINLALSVVRMAFDDVYTGVQDELNSLPKDASVLDKVRAVFVGIDKGIFHFAIHVASFFYDWHYDEIEAGRKIVAEISDYHKYYSVIKEDGGTTAIDFSSGQSSWNGGGITFCLADQGQSQLCMDYFVSSDESFGKKCWSVDTDGSKDIILGLGESHELEHATLQKKILMFIPAGSVTVVNGTKAVSYSRYGTYRGNRDSNRFFAVQTSADEHMMEVMLSYYYKLYGEPGDDIFFLGPQRSYIEGSGGKDTYMIPENGGKTIINNYDPSKALDTLHFSVNYGHISVQKSGDDVVLMYTDSHTVTIQKWFLGELYRHVNMMSGDGVLFEISSTVISSVQLVARGINKRFMTQGQRVDASEPLLRTVTNIHGSQFDDVIIGNAENNLIDGGGGRDRLTGGEGEDIYVVKDRRQSSVLIENDSRDNKTDLVTIEAALHTFEVNVEGDDLHLRALLDNTVVHVTLVNWFRSSADRHLLIVTKDLITFTISDNKADCLQTNPFTSCIKSRRIDYSSSPSALVVDLQEDNALHNVTEVHGSQFEDVIKGNKEGNVFIPESGDDFMEGRGGEDWYVISPGPGVKTINNQSPDRALDILFLRERFQKMGSVCEGRSVVLLVHGRKTAVLQNWFDSKDNQHLQIKTSDGITAGLRTNISSCGGSLLLPLTVDYRKQTPEPLQSREDRLQKGPANAEGSSSCYRYRTKDSVKLLCGLQGKVMMMDEVDSVKEMFGSAGFDVMVGNKNENVMDPYTGGGLMFGGEGRDTYIIKHGYGNSLLIDNFAEDNSTDTVLVDMDFLDGGQVALTSSEKDLNLTITTKEEELKLSLLGYHDGDQHQHLEFQTTDGVRFRLKDLNSTGSVPLLQTEAFKVTLKQLQVDCRLDLNALRNLSKVQTVQGCPSQSNSILGNIQDNALIGGWKDDILEGGEGDDTLIGGHGADILAGGTGDDTLYGEEGNDTLLGDSGRDVFIPGPGADLVDGGSGRDTVLYRGDHKKHQGVYVNLLSGQGRYGDAEGDVLKDVEIVIGSIYSDILVSGYESSLLKGSDGNDLLVSTGDDYLVGGDGKDIYMLAFRNGSTTIDNCAKDNAEDILYLDSLSSPGFGCQTLSDRAVLTFSGSDGAVVKVGLVGWFRDGGGCGHLVVVHNDLAVPADLLLQTCELDQLVSRSN